MGQHVLLVVGQVIGLLWLSQQYDFHEPTAQYYLRVGYIAYV